MIPTSFRGHEAIGGLVALAAAALPGLQIIRGPRRQENLSSELLMVAWDPQAQNHVVARRLDQDANMLGRATEVGEIACYIAVRSGDGNIETVTARGVEILTTLEAALRADRSGLSGSVDAAEIGPDMALIQYQTNEGASIGLPFTVTYTAYI